MLRRYSDLFTGSELQEVAQSLAIINQPHVGLCRRQSDIRR